MTTTSDRNLLDELRVTLPGVADPVLKLELFNTCDELAREALRIAAPTDVDADPVTWLSAANYTAHYQTLLHGTLWRLFAQPGKPYTSLDLAKAHDGLYRDLLRKSTGEAAGAPTTAYERLLYNLRTQFPQVRDVSLQLEIYSVVDKIRRDALGLAPLTGADTAVTTWLTASQYESCYQAILHGTMYSLLGQQDGSKPDIIKLHFDSFRREVDLLTAEDAGTPTSAYDRLVSNVRTQLPQARELSIKLEIYSIVDKIRQEALRQAALSGTDTATTTWLTTTEYASAYQCILHGVLYSMLAKQEGANPELVKQHYALFRQELDLLRTTDATTAATTALTRLLNNARISLPGALDAGIKLELFNVLDEFFQQSSYWQEEIDYATIVGTTSYDLGGGSEPGQIISLLSNVNSDGNAVPATMLSLGTLVLNTEPSTVETLTATVSYTVVDPVDGSSYPQIPDYVLEKYGVGILAGLIGRMQVQPAKPYSNQQLGIFNLRKFSTTIAQAGAAVLHQNLYGGQTWRFPTFAAGSQR